MSVFAGSVTYVYKEFKAFLVASALYLKYYRALRHIRTAKTMLAGFPFEFLRKVQLVYLGFSRGLQESLLN